jgi:hypothetical protein
MHCILPSRPGAARGPLQATVWVPSCLFAKPGRAALTGQPTTRPLLPGNMFCLKAETGDVVWSKQVKTYMTQLGVPLPGRQLKQALSRCFGS